MSESYPSRRSVLRGGAVTVAAGVVGYVVAASSDAAGTAGPTAAANGYGGGEQTGRRLAAVADIPAGGGLILAEAKVVLTRGAADEVSALSATCTHQGCTVSSIEDRLVVCPCHLSRFDLSSGAPVSGPATRALPAVEVEVRGTDVYTV